VNPLISGMVSGVVGSLDGLFTSDEERMAAELKITTELSKPHILQALINMEEAKHPSVFVAGWRPALGWLTVFSLGYAWILRDFVMIVLQFFEQTKHIVLPSIDTGDLMTLVLALLGLGGIRAYEAVKGVKRHKINK